MSVKWRVLAASRAGAAERGRFAVPPDQPEDWGYVGDLPDRGVAPQAGVRPKEEGVEGETFGQKVGILRHWSNCGKLERRTSIRVSCQSRLDLEKKKC